MKKLEFNKIVVGASVLIAFALTIYCVIRDSQGYDISNMVTLTGLTWGEVTGVTSAYSFKTKALNKIKMIKSLPKELQDNVDVNQILN